MLRHSKALQAPIRPQPTGHRAEARKWRLYGVMPAIIFSHVATLQIAWIQLIEIKS
jgi:hypothetical protein